MKLHSTTSQMTTILTVTDMITSNLAGVVLGWVYFYFTDNMVRQACEQLHVLIQ
jgi:hypothetical protein